MNNQIASGIAWMGGSLASFVLMAIASRELSNALSVFQILFFRSAIGLLIMAVFIRSLLPEFRAARSLGLHVVRNCVHFSAQYCWTVGVVLLPLAEVFALEFTMPVWVAVFSHLLLKEQICRPRIIAIGMSFAGVLIILRPGAGSLEPAALVVLLAAMGYALSIVIVKRLTLVSSSAMIIAWMTIIQFPMGLAFSVFEWNTPTPQTIPWIIVAGLTGLSAHYSLAQGLRHLDASAAIPIDFLRVPIIALVGFVLYDESLEIWLFVGAIMIFGSNYYALRIEASKHSRDPDEARSEAKNL